MLKFLEPYNQEDKDSYHGREEEILYLYKKVKQYQLTLLYGLSGTGKTSLISCGLCNEFDPDDWRSFIIRRGNNQRISTAFRNTLAPEADVELSLFDLLGDVYTAYYKPVYMIFDQLEELFLYGDSAERTEFIDFIRRVLDQAPYAKIILVIRQEYFVYLDEFEERIPEIFQGRMKLERMSRKKVVTTIREIAAQEKIRVTDEVTDLIISHISIKRHEDKFRTDLSSLQVDNIDLPSLQVYLYEVVKKNADKIAELPPEGLLELGKDDLPEIGTINDVLSDYVHQAVKEVESELNTTNPEITDDLIWQVLNSLVSYEGTKQQKSIDEIQKILS
ncbi:hypothetical protein [Chitinophaga sp. MM2321]|uniref:nSTAND1 domain-containing NTPase n=1 Tax=Chitinophaga sp. MM2321 TaxID=3137178 RepID=UPI0032D59F4F